ncbi:hypothetical protein FIU84_04960 [Stutzerimonas frequens]|nr:hypothetical protein FIU84_04960 [Stutzerimonas frequens]
MYSDQILSGKILVMGLLRQLLKLAKNRGQEAGLML